MTAMRIPAGFVLPTRPPGRCTLCGFHPPTQGHREHCPDAHLGRRAR